MEFLESIFVKNKKIENLYYHQLRIQKAQKTYHLIDNKDKNWVFGLDDILQKFIDEFFQKKDHIFLENQVYKLRLLYGEKINFLELLPYYPKNIHKLALVEVYDFSYFHKYTDRTMLNSFLAQKKTEELKNQQIEIDEVILVKNSHLTDTSYSNILWTYDLKEWYTTPFPLLEGTFRAKLLAEEKIFLKEITLKNYRDFSHFRLINALLQDQSPILSVKQIMSL